MTPKVPAILLNTKNEEVLSYLAPLSCHGDNIEPLQALLDVYSDVAWFCPDVKNYRYFLWYTGDTVFAYGAGMQHVGLKIPHGEAALASKLAVENSQFDGESWYSFRYDCRQLNDLVKQAYTYAKS